MAIELLSTPSVADTGRTTPMRLTARYLDDKLGAHFPTSSSNSFKVQLCRGYSTSPVLTGQTLASATDMTPSRVTQACTSTGDLLDVATGSLSELSDNITVGRAASPGSIFKARIL